MLRGNLNIYIVQTLTPQDIISISGSGIVIRNISVIRQLTAKCLDIAKLGDLDSAKISQVPQILGTSLQNIIK